MYARARLSTNTSTSGSVLSMARRRRENASPRTALVQEPIEGAAKSIRAHEEVSPKPKETRNSRPD